MLAEGIENERLSVVSATGLQTGRIIQRMGPRVIEIRSHAARANLVRSRKPMVVGIADAAPCTQSSILGLVEGIQPHSREAVNDRLRSRVVATDIIDQLVNA